MFFGEGFPGLDFDGDGEVDLTESYLSYKMYQDGLDEEDRDDEDDD